MGRPTIICVDDERVVLTAIKSQLTRHFEDDYEIEITESAEEALEVLEELIEENCPVPLIISDQIMPGMKGDEFLKISHQKSPKTINVLLTGQADATAVGNAVNNAKLYRYIAKPWDETDLVLTVKEATRRYFQDEKLEEQNRQLIELNQSLELKVIERTEEIQRQKEIIEQKNINITDSITYAKRIQTAVMPCLHYISNYIDKFFIYYRPKDIVSGDFYWFKNIGKYNIIAIADCTGHGVPGAFMSMLGIASLNDIIKKKENIEAGNILDELRFLIKNTLDQTGAFEEAKDGMDIALCVIDTETNMLQFAGAYNPLYIFRKKGLPEIPQYEKPLPGKTTITIDDENSIYNFTNIRANHQPIGVYIKEQPFTNNEIQLLKGDKLYMFTDGYADQFGGKHRKKYTQKNFVNLLLDIQNQTMEQQSTTIEKNILEWMGDTMQIDDILVFGMEIT